MGMAMLMNPHVSAQLLAYQFVPSFIPVEYALVNPTPIAEKWSVPRGRVKLLLNSVCVAIRMVAKGVVIEGGPDTRPRGTEGGSQLPAQCTGLDVTETWWRNVTSLGGLQGEDRTLPGSRGGRRGCRCFGT